MPELMPLWQVITLILVSMSIFYYFGMYLIGMFVGDVFFCCCYECIGLGREFKKNKYVSRAIFINAKREIFIGQTFISYCFAKIKGVPDVR